MTCADEESARDCNLDDYLNAPSGGGALAAAWKDKPHRLVYDLVSEVKRLRATLADQAIVLRRVLSDNDRLIAQFDPATPSYSTADVDALIDAIERECASYETQNSKIDDLADAVRATREPRR